MKKILYSVVMLCVIVVAMCTIYQINTQETTLEVAASELSEVHCWAFRGYSEVVYNGESYIGKTNLLHKHSGMLEKVILRKKGIFSEIVSVKYK